MLLAPLLAGSNSATLAIRATTLWVATEREHTGCYLFYCLRMLATLIWRVAGQFEITLRSALPHLPHFARTHSAAVSQRSNIPYSTPPHLTAVQ